MNDLLTKILIGGLTMRYKQYVNGKVSTNSIESAWACLKRTIYGIYHQVSKKHLPKYVDEFTLRFNARKYKTQESVELVFLSSIGKKFDLWGINFLILISLSF
ncbi:MAG: transposase [Mollicutes bacterium UO1]